MNVGKRDVQSIVNKLPRYFKAMQVPCQSVRVSHALLECHAPLGVTSTMVRSTRLTENRGPNSNASGQSGP